MQELDIGCNDGSRTKKFARKIDTARIYGVDIIDEHIQSANEKGIQASKYNIEDGLPFDNETFDVVLSNQVIEHLVGTDFFIQNIYRVLKKGGYTVIATENSSYLANIFAIILVYQAFSQNISDRYHVGNPFSTAAGQIITDRFSTHKRIFSIKGLSELLRKYGFKIEAALGAGFAPLPPFFSRIDKIHSRFIIVKARKS